MEMLPMFREVVRFARHVPGHGRGRGGGERGTRRAADFGLLLAACASTLHLLMNHRVIHRHTPARGHGGGLGKGGGRHRREAQFFRQPRRDFLMRPQTPTRAAADKTIWASWVPDP